MRDCPTATSNAASTTWERASALENIRAFSFLVYHPRLDEPRHEI